MVFDVIFEKQAGDNWIPTPSTELQQGDRTRLKTINGDVLGEGLVTAKKSTDPDSKIPFDLAIDWMEK
jgi:hypothetical protein